MRRAVLVAAAAVAVAAFAAFAATFAAAAAEPRGPVFGNNAYEGEIRDDGGPDADAFVGPLLAGERLSVSVAAARGSPLRPVLALLDPAGEDRTPLLRTAGGGVSFRSFIADVPGRWTVRVAGAGDTEGGYAVRFRVRSGGPASRRSRPPGPAPRSPPTPSPGGGGARPAPGGGGAGPGPPSLDVLDPSGAPHPLAPILLWRRGSAWVLDDLPLDRGDGTWRIVAGVGERGLRVAVRVSLDGRPRGRTILGAVEPRLEERDAPHDAIPGSAVRLMGTGFSRGESPSVWIGGLRAAVLATGSAGDRIDVAVPVLPPGGPVEVVVANPDGQACVAPGYLRAVAPGPPVVREFLPAEVRLVAGAAAEVRVLLAGHAPPEGIDIPLSVEGGVGTAPPSVHAAPHALEASFVFTAGILAAGTAEAKGLLRASLGGSVVVPVVVSAPPPPDSLDLAGWRLRQTSASKTWVLPEGTTVPRGGALVVARKSDRASFEAFWGAPLGAGVAFLDSGDRFPSLNGDETISLEDPDGNPVDGPTVALEPGRCYRRIPGTAAGLPGSWIEGVAAPGAVVPGGPPPAGTGAAAPYVSQFADPAGTGQFVHEFVEIRWEGGNP